MRRQLIGLIVMLLCSTLQAQKLAVKRMELAGNDISGSQYVRHDLNGTACALVKVLLAVPNTKFEGNIIPPAEFRTSEYWVYLSDGARELNIKAPGYISLHVVFADYGITEVKAKTTYNLLVQSVNAKDAQMQKISVHYTPSDAIVLIDSKPYQGQNGVAIATLPVGQHDIIVTSDGYKAYKGSVNLEASTPSKVTAYLKRNNPTNATTTSKGQFFTICYTPKNAIILIDLKPYLNRGGVVTTTLPVGQHNYIVTSDGYTPFDGTVTLKGTDPGSVTVNLERSAPIAQPKASSDSRLTFTVGGIPFTMIKVTGGTFTMGAVNGRDGQAYDNEKPAHEVTLSDFSIGETEVTQALWQAVMGTNPSKYIGSNHPVEQVSWEDCQKFIAKLNEITGHRFRLPTEAEWEYAARGGNKSHNTMYSGGSSIDTVAWYEDNSKWQMRDVKTKMPNELGLYDMTGSVEEWCQDRYDYYPSTHQTNPKGTTSGAKRVFRGGHLGSSPRFSRVSSRSSDTPSHRWCTIGFRLAQYSER